MMRRIPSSAIFDELAEGKNHQHDAGGAAATAAASGASSSAPQQQQEREAFAKAATPRSADLSGDSLFSDSPSPLGSSGHRRQTSEPLAHHSIRFAEQLHDVVKILRQQQLIHADRVQGEVDWYYDNLGLNAYYFTTNTASAVAQHISSLYSAKIVAQLNQAPLKLQIENASHGRALLVCRSLPGEKDSPTLRLEPRIEEQYLGDASSAASGGKYGLVPEAASTDPTAVVKNRRWKLHCYRTSGFVSEGSPIKLRFFFLSEPQYPAEFPAPQALTETRLERIADSEWLRLTPPDQREAFHEVITQATVKRAPAVKVTDVIRPDSDRVHRHLLIAYRHGSTHGFMSGITVMYHSLGYHSADKYVEQFSNGITVMSIFLRPLAANAPGARSPLPESEFPTTAEELTLCTNQMFILPRTSLSHLMREQNFSPAQHAYVYIAWKFAFHFMGRNNTAFQELERALSRKKDADKHLGVLYSIRSQMRLESMTEGQLLDIIERNPAAGALCYEDFMQWHNPAMVKDASKPLDRNISSMMEKINRVVNGATERKVFAAFLYLNRYTLKTNFYKHRKLAYSFRLDPTFLEVLTGGYSITPYGLFFLIGSEFRGFHVRFSDVARGGIRLIRSSNREAFTQNCTSVFDENYNLAYTQEKKNKDIPEGGSKGTILLSLDHQDRGEIAFAKYVDALLDLLLLPNARIIDYSQRTEPELLFLGPDEGTAHLMDSACDHAASRGYGYAMSFATGKTPHSHGGIPHDVYGMTTRGVHAYVVGSIKNLGLQEENVTKVQTGGPDGDLGSNEILISKDRLLAVVDGSGVLYDANGLDRESIVHLAKERKMSRAFPLEKLSDRGFFVDVDQSNIRLPATLGGEEIESGFAFRNNFHLHRLFKADVFVPCGGRPEAINATNVGVYLHPEPRFKIIVEGANLFITQEARLALEHAGVVLFKDASANKGGVTSSSLEVLAALSLTPAEYQEHMCGEVKPAFYEKYVQDVLTVVEKNAQLEFERLWKEHALSGANGQVPTPRCVLTDKLSVKINDLSKMVMSSAGDHLWTDATLRYKVLSQAVPPSLQELVGGIEQVEKRVPVSYLRAMFAAYLSSRYVYCCGFPASPEFAFFEFLRSFVEKTE